MAKKTNGGALKKDPTVPKISKSQAKAREAFNKAESAFKKAQRGSKEYDDALRRINHYGPLTGKTNWNAKYTNLKPITDQERYAARPVTERRSELEAGAQQQALDVMQQGQQFDINRPYAGYEMGFGEARDKAYSDVMAQFNRSMEPEFQRQNAEFQQRMADQGLDPASGAYQAQYKALADSQNNARLNAQSQASQQAYQVQQQAFTQGQEASLQPLEFYKATSPLWQMPWEQAGQANLANISGQYGLKQQNLQNAGALANTRLSGANAMSIAKMQEEQANERARQDRLSQYPPGQQPKKPSFGAGVASTGPTGVLIGSQG